VATEKGEQDFKGFMHYRIMTRSQSAPTRAAVLLNLTRMETEEGNRMEMVGHPAIVIWINDGLEIEETQ
jgi:hypothetical protein